MQDAQILHLIFSIKCQKFLVIEAVDSKFQFDHCQKKSPCADLVLGQFEMHGGVRRRLSRTIQLLSLRQHLDGWKLPPARVDEKSQKCQEIKRIQKSKSICMAGR